MNKMDKKGGDKVHNSETVEYELDITVNDEKGKLINLYLQLKARNRTEKSSASCLGKYRGLHKFEEGQIVTSNKLLQFVPVAIIRNVKRLLLTWGRYYVKERFPTEICGFQALQELKIASRHGKDSGLCLKHLPREIRKLKNLRILEVSSFDYLEELPSGIGNLKNLRELHIYQCDSLLHLPAELGNLKRLRRLDISRCNKLQDLPPTISNLENLEDLSVHYCFHLTQLPPETGNLKQLHKLKIDTIGHSWNGTEAFRLECTNFVNLQEMKIVSCESLVHWPQEIGNMRCLQKLWIERCENLENLPSEIGNLESLQEMMIINCKCMKDLPPEIGNLRCLRKLEITIKPGFSRTKNLNSIPLEVGNLPSLQEFGISYDGCLDHLILVINKLKRNLQRLYIDYHGRYGLNYGDRSVTSSTHRVQFGLSFKMTFEELNFYFYGKVANRIEILNNFLESMAAENSPFLPITLLLPQGVRCIKIDLPWYIEFQEHIDQEPIRKLLQKYPTLGRICLEGRRIFYDFSADTLHMMYLNRFVRSLKYKANATGEGNLLTLLAENALPIIFKEVQTSIRRDFVFIFKRTNLKNPTTICANVIYSIVRELVLPLLLDH